MAAAAMNLFPDGAFVRLWSRFHRWYVKADEDGLGVSLSHPNMSLNGAWRVHRINLHGLPWILLYGAAYGRYLTVTDDRAPSGHRGQRVVQGYFDHPEDLAAVWTVVQVGGGSDDVFLRHINTDRLLRANGKYRIWHKVVTVDLKRSTMMHWAVEVLKPRPEPPIILAPNDQYEGGFLGWLRKPRAEPIMVRTIRYVLADNSGNVDEQGWGTFLFHNRSVFTLRSEVAQHLGQPAYTIVVCARAGRYGRLAPLTNDISRSLETMDIVAVPSGSPIVQEFKYPIVRTMSFYFKTF